MTNLDQIVAHTNMVIYENLLAEAAKAKHGGYGEPGRRHWRDLLDEARAMKARGNA